MRIKDRIDLNFNEYVNHATRSGDSLEKMCHLLDYGINERDISRYFATLKGELFFKRNASVILEKKSPELAGFLVIRECKRLTDELYW